MSEVAGKVALAWLRRAETIRSKAELLQSDMIEALGVEHYLTDEGDNVMDTANDLCFALSRYSSPKTPNDGE